MFDSVKRKIALALAVLIMVACCSIAFTVSAESGPLFEDDFSSGTLTGWNSSSVGKISGGSYCLSEDMANIVTKTGVLTDFAVTADVKSEILKSQSGFDIAGSTYIVARANADMTAGYEFGISVLDSSTAYVRLYRRNGATSTILRQTSTVNGAAVVPGKTYNLKLVTTGNRLICFVDGKFFFSITDTEIKSGYAGVRNIAGSGSFDNFSVEHIPEQKVEKIEITNHSASVSRVGKLYFDLCVTYNSVYGTELLNQDSAGVTYSGFDRTAGKKTVTVSYGGKTTQFDVMVNSSFKSETIFIDEFNDDLSKYNGGTNTVNGKEYNFAVKGGQVYATLPNIGDNAASVVMSLPQSYLSNHMTYSVSTDCYITSSKYSTRTAEASLLFAKNDKGRYEIRVQGTMGSIRLYKDGAVIQTLKASNFGIDLQDGKKINIRINAYADYVEFLVQGKKVAHDFDIGGSFEPCVGIGAFNGDVKFDRLEVTTLEEKDPTAATNIELVSASGAPVTKITASSFSYTDNVLKLTYVDGSIGYKKITDDMLSDYDPKSSKPQTVTVTYCGKKMSVVYNYIPYYFYDDFENGMNSRWNLSTPEFTTADVVNGRLKFTYSDPTGTASSSVASIKGTEELTDYTISADVMFDNRSVSSHARYIILQARRGTGNEANNYYELRLYASVSGSVQMMIGRFENGVYTELAVANDALIKTAISNAAKENGTTAKGLGSGYIYNISFTVCGTKLKAYIDGIQILIYDDGKNPDHPAYLKGKCGIRNICSISYFDNVTVKPANAKATKVEIGGTENNTIDIYKGGDIETYKYRFKVYYEDGSCDTSFLTYEMIGAYDNLSVGKQTVTISDGEFSTDIILNVLERPDHVKEVDKALSDFAGVKTETDLEKFKAVKEKYDSLTPWEVSQLSKTAVDNFENGYDQYDRFLYGDLLGDSDLLWSDHFNDYSTDNWTTAVGEKSQTFFFGKNGHLYEASRSYTISATGWHAPSKAYGNISSVSCDFLLINTDVYAGVAINIGTNGYYQTRVSTKTRDENENVVHTLQLMKKVNGAHSIISSVIIETYDVFLTDTEWFNLRITYKDGKITAYVNDIAMLSANDDDAPYTVGMGGTRISEGDALVDNFRVYGKAVERAEKRKPVITPTKYTDDFNDEKAGQNPNYWLEDSVYYKVIDNWKVYDKGGLCYGTQNTSGRVNTWLHVFDDDITVSMKLMTDNVKANAKVGIITRRSPRTVFADIGYDFKEHKWFIYSQVSEQVGPQYIYSDKAFEFKTGTWYTVNVTEKGSNVKVDVDGTTVIEADNVIQTYYGRVGAFAENASLYIDDVNCTFSSGDIPQDGIIGGYIMDASKYAAHMEVENPYGDTFVGVNYDDIEYISKDRGLTWTDTSNARQYPGLTFGTYPTILKLKNGNYLKFVEDGSDVYCAISTDKMKTWKYQGQVVPYEKQIDDLGRRNIIWHVNSCTEFIMKDGTDRIFMPITHRNLANDGSPTGHYSEFYYSDDQGKTWQCSEITTETLLPGYDAAESYTCSETKVIQCADGDLRVYYSRNRLGCMQYFESHDEGLTWEGIYQIPEIQLSLSSFSVMEDPNNPGTFYMLCLNGTPESIGSYIPRNRLMLLRSYDGKNWEYLMHFERMNLAVSDTNGMGLYQIVDPSLYIDDDYIYCSFGLSEREYAKYDANSHQAQRTNFYKVAKDKLTGRGWDATNIDDMEYPKSIALKVTPQSKFGLGDLFTAEGVLEITNFYGEKVEESTRLNCKIYEQPNMFKLGKQTVKMYYSNDMMVSYDIEIVPNYTLTWNIYGNGTVEPQDLRIMQGAAKTFTLIPDKGNKVASVFVNGNKITVKKNTFTIENASENYDIEVEFSPLTILDYWYFILAAAVLVALIAVVIIIAVKKKKTNNK